MIDKSKEKLTNLYQNNYSSNYNYGYSTSLYCGMTKEVFSKKESYYHKPIKIIKAKNIKLALLNLLDFYFARDITSLISTY